MEETTAWLATTLTARALVGPAIAADAPATSGAPWPARSCPWILKAGDHVRIGYVDNQGQMTAETITGHDHTAKH